MLFAMVTWGGTRRLVSSEKQGWDFPDIDDRTPSAHSDEGPEPARLPSRGRLAVAAVVGIAVIGLAIAAFGVVSRSQSTELPTLDPLEPASQTTAAPSVIVVHVSGAVVSPGLVEMVEGQRVFDVLESAGGPTVHADVNMLNLARPVIDGEHIVVPEKGTIARPVTIDGANEPISLSRSSADRLEQLPGVGPALAQRIIAWREEHGSFGTIDDVLAVSGIGTATLEGFRDQVVP